MNYIKNQSTLKPDLSDHVRPRARRYEKGYNVVTLTDCTAEEGQEAATSGTYGLFSAPMTKDEFLAKVE